MNQVDMKMHYCIHILIYLYVTIVYCANNDTNRLSYNVNNYFIKPEYTIRENFIHYDDTENTDKFQDDIYNYAKTLVTNNKLKTIADVGCGSGYKLIKYFGDKFMYKTIGLEIEPSLSFLKEKYPLYQWEFSDFNSIAPITNVDIIICSDVIEHLINPDLLLKWLSTINSKYLVISTPDREGESDIMRDISHLDDAESNRAGPPSNPAHIREWGIDEFKMYLQQYFKVVHHNKLAFMAYDRIYVETQFIVAQKYENNCRCNPGEYMIFSNYDNTDNYDDMEENLKVFIQSSKVPVIICSQNYDYYGSFSLKSIVYDESCILIKNHV